MLSYKAGGDIMPGADVKIISTNIFKNGEKTASQEQFTRKWGELITQMEKYKNQETVKGWDEGKWE